MNIENGFLYAIISEEGMIGRSVDAGVVAKDFDSKDLQDAYQFVLKYHSQNESPPSRELLKDVCGVQVTAQGAEVKFLFTEFVKRKMFRKVNANVDMVDRALKSNDPDRAYDMMAKFVEEFKPYRGVEPTNMFTLGDGVVDRYDRLMRGERGITLPWPTIDAITMGLWPATATYFAGRPKSGKTTLMMVLIHHIWNQDHRVLVFSPEMSKDELAEKFYTMLTRIAASDVLRGTLSAFQYKRLLDQVEQSRGLDGIYLMDSIDDNLDPYSMEEAIMRVKPDVVFADSIYRLDFPGKDESEVVAKAVKWIGSACKRYKIPFVNFHQLSRKAITSQKAGGAGYSSAAIALTDKLLWDANAVYLIESNKDLRSDKKLIIHPTDVRRGVWNGEPILLNWDLDENNYTEAGKEKEGFVDDEPVPF